MKTEMSTVKGSLTEVEVRKREYLKSARPRVYEKVINYAAKAMRGESIAILQFQYDYRCNFHCKHCCISKMKQHRRHFTLDDVRELSRQADELGLAHVTITGGEPLIFHDLDLLVEAIDPNKFYIAIDSNGWFLDDKKARHLKSIGIEKVHLSLDSISPKEHDDFRRKPGSHARVLKAIDASLNAELSVLLNTVVTKQRAYSQEFIDFLEFTEKLGVGVVLMLAKLAGEWEGHSDVILTQEDLIHVREFEKRYNAFTHLVSTYGLDLGCIAVKRMVSITRYGDVMPCPWIHVSIGNVFEEPLKHILERGMNIRFLDSVRRRVWEASRENSWIIIYASLREGNLRYAIRKSSSTRIISNEKNGLQMLISIVTPCYNEEENLEMLCRSVREVFARIGKYEYEHIIIDNDSTDSSQAILRHLAASDHRIKVIINSRNFGCTRSPHHALLQASGDAVITMVADFQDPPDMIALFLERWEAGYKIVLGVKRESDESHFILMMRRLYYHLIGRLSELPLVKNFTGLAYTTAVL